jgi:hypothetical protein
MSRYDDPLGTARLREIQELGLYQNNPNFYPVPTTETTDEEDDLEVRTRAADVTSRVFRGAVSAGERASMLLHRQEVRREMEDAFVSFAQTVEKYLRTGE